MCCYTMTCDIAHRKRSVHIWLFKFKLGSSWAAGYKAQHIPPSRQTLLLYTVWLKDFSDGVSCLLADSELLQLLVNAVTDQ